MISCIISDTLTSEKIAICLVICWCNDCHSALIAGGIQWKIRMDEGLGDKLLDNDDDDNGDNDTDDDNDNDNILLLRQSLLSSSSKWYMDDRWW